MNFLNSCSALKMPPKTPGTILFAQKSSNLQGCLTNFIFPTFTSLAQQTNDERSKAGFSLNFHKIFTLVTQ